MSIFEQEVQHALELMKDAYDRHSELERCISALRGRTSLSRDVLVGIYYTIQSYEL